MALRRVPRFPTTKAPIHYSEWDTWLHEAPLQIHAPEEYDFHRADGKARDLSNFVSTLVSRGSGSKQLAAAFYYRLHMHVEDLRFANSIDRIVFNGKTFAEQYRGKCVFDLDEVAYQQEALAANLRAEIDGNTAYDNSASAVVGIEIFPNVNSTKHSPARLPRHTGGFFGRKREIRSVLNDLKRQKTKIVVICAPGGQGKTALVEAVLNSLPNKSNSGYDWVFEWSFYNQGAETGSASSDQFFGAIYAFLGIPLPSGPQPDRSTPLADYLSAHRGLLVLDGLETLQHAPGMQSGRIHDTDIRRLIQKLQHFNAGSCIITTRIKTSDLVGEFGESVSFFSLDNFSQDEAVYMLKSLGVRGHIQEIEEVASEAKRNPMALRLIGNYLRLVHDGRAQKWREIVVMEEDANQGGPIERMLRRYSNWLEAEDKAVWELVAFFRRPATQIEAETLWLELRGLTSNSASALDPFKRAISRLSDIGLLYPPTSLSFFDCHPIIREYQRIALKSDSEEWVSGHLALGRLLERSVQANPAHISEFFNLYDAVFHFVSAGLHQYAWEEIVVPRIWQGTQVSTNVFGLLSVELETLKCFFEIPFIRSSDILTSDQRAQLGSQVGFILSSLNELSSAMDIQSETYRLRSESGNWQDANIAAGSAAEYGLIIGDLSRSVKFMSRAMLASRKMSDVRWRLAAFCTAGAIRHEMGRPKTAQLHFSRAHQLFEQERATGERFLSRASGFNLLWCLTDQVEDDIWASVLRREPISGDALATADQLFAWAMYCVEANDRLPLPVPIYEGWFKILRARLSSILQLKASDEDSDLYSTDLPDARDAIGRASLARFAPLVSIVEIDTVIYRSMRIGGVESQLWKMVVSIFESTQETVREGHLERYQAMLYLRLARFEYLAVRSSGTTFDTDRYLLAARRCSLLGYNRMSRSIDSIISAGEGQKTRLSTQLNFPPISHSK